MGGAIKVGHPIPLSLQLFDGNEAQRVRATVLAPDGKVISEVLLAHQRQGLYFSAAVSMPNEDFVFVTYEVLEPVGLERYEKTSETILRDDGDTQAKSVVEALTPKATKWIVGQVYASVEHEGFILGRVTE